MDLELCPALNWEPPAAPLVGGYPRHEDASTLEGSFLCNL